LVITSERFGLISASSSAQSATKSLCDRLYPHASEFSISFALFQNEPVRNADTAPLSLLATAPRSAPKSAQKPPRHELDPWPTFLMM
jgi:hypothetical protein